MTDEPRFRVSNKRPAEVLGAYNFAVVSESGYVIIEKRSSGSSHYMMYRSRRGAAEGAGRAHIELPEAQVYEKPVEAWPPPDLAAFAKATLSTASECPECDATSAEPCYTPDGRQYTPVHQARVDLMMSRAAGVWGAYQETGVPITDRDGSAPGLFDRTE